MIEDFHGSLVKFTQDFISSARGDGVSSDLGFINLDAHAEIHEWPSTDLIGLQGFAVQTDDRMYEIDAALFVMTLNDANLFRHYRLLDRLFKALKPEQKLKLYSADTALAKSWMVVLDGTSILPVGRAETRPLQPVRFTLAVNPGPGAA